MPTKYTGRFVLIFTVLLVAMWAIIPNPAALFDKELTWSQKLNLKPGIDMAGGVSLLYEIQADTQSSLDGDVAEQVMAALKKRVDPEGVRNLVWRPQQGNRLEIQMPLGGSNAKTTEIRDTFTKARDALEATNVRPGRVLALVESTQGTERASRLQALAGGWETRQKLFDRLAAAYDRLQAAKRDRNPALQAEADLDYERLTREIDRTNLSPEELQSVLEAPNSQTRQQRLSDLRLAATGFPARDQAIDGFIAAFAEFDKVRGALDDAGDLKRLLRGSGVLEFYILASPRDPEISSQVQSMLARLQPGEKGPGLQGGDELRWMLTDRPEEFLGRPDVVVGTYNEKNYVLVDDRLGKSLTKRSGAWGLRGAGPTSDPRTGESLVAFNFDTQGAVFFGELTGSNVNRPLGIVLDGRLISAPNIQSRIDGYGTINGGANGFSRAERQYLIATLNAGSLPAKLSDDPISERTVGPQLGADNLRAGLLACVFGLVVVAVFLISYYYLSGLVAFIAVMMNMVLILGFMAAYGATFTLPGVAGIVLTIGMAVDANVLIFERLREEQQRGMNLRMALRNAYDKAWYAIVDANVTTGITSLGLYLFGSEEVRGFGLTLILGIASSMFTALFVTKTIFGLLIDYADIKTLGSVPLTFPKWDRLLRPDVNWMGIAKYFIGFSTVFIVGGLVLFGIAFSRGEMLDIEFARGTSVQFELKTPTPIAEVRQLIGDYAEKNPAVLPSPGIVSVGTDDLNYEVVTPNEKASEVRAAVVAALGQRLNIRVPSSFDGGGDSFETALAASRILPIESVTQTFTLPDGTSASSFRPDALADHIGGVAIVLTNLNPPLTPSEVQRRMEQTKLQASVGGSGTAYRSLSVESPAGDDKPSSTLLILASDPAFAFDVDDVKRQQWESELATGVWALTNDAISRPAELQKVSNFDAQVAGKTSREAFIALLIAIGGIVAYVWVRFGNLKYGFATVLALAHDTLFVLAAIGLAHFISDWYIARQLMIEPFRINLTMVAAILTVMGYSMNDTVVVFDRIRENRDKYGGRLDAKIINDSINQTLSRTLLTGGTTLVTIAVMYATGGPGIHGFTFALLVGIVVGTYSSIAIAAPLLLLGTKSAPATTTSPKSPSATLGTAASPG